MEMHLEIKSAPEVYRDGRKSHMINFLMRNPAIILQHVIVLRTSGLHQFLHYRLAFLHYQLNVIRILHSSRMYAPVSLPTDRREYPAISRHETWVSPTTHRQHFPSTPLLSPRPHFSFVPSPNFPLPLGVIV